MDEILLLVFFMFLHMGVPKESEHCKIYMKSEEEGKGMLYDLNSFKGLQIIGLEVEDHVNISNKRPTMQLMVNLCETLVNNEICNTTGSVCIFHTSDVHKIFHTNDDDSIVFKSGSEEILNFDLVGSPCKSDNSKKFIVHFNFLCKLPSDDVFPNILATWDGPDSCEAQVHWMTGGSCGVVDEEYPCSVHIEHGYSVDLNPLRSESFWGTFDPSTNKTYQLNVCGPIKQSKCAGAYFCEIDQDSNKSLILADVMYVNFNRQLGIVLCFAKRDRGRCKAEVVLQCVPDNNDFNQPMLSHKGSTRKKNKLFVLETPLGCMVPSALCVAVNEKTGEHYSLYSLAGQILEFNYGASKVILSVCGIIHKQYNRKIPCSGPGYASCHVREENVIRVMGMQGQAPEVTPNNTIRIVYPDGDLCPFGKTRQRYKTYLDLYCDKTLSENQIEEAGCEMFVKYATPAACPSRELLGKNCIVQDPQLNMTLNLNPLRDGSKDMVIRIPEPNSAIRFNLCGPLLEPCNGISNTSFCFYRNGTGYPIGVPAVFPKYDDAMVKFEMFGPPCDPSVNYTKLTLILSCDYAATFFGSSAVSVQYEMCQFYLVGKTNLTCPSFSDPFRCNIQNFKSGEWFDLSHLSREYKLKLSIPVRNISQDVDLVVSICSSIASNSTSPCPPNSAVCMRIPSAQKLVTNGTRQEESRYISLGRGDTAPFFDEDGVLKLRLVQGDDCEGPEISYYSSTITFICDRGIQHQDSKPEFVSQGSTACHLNFDWKVSFACSHRHKTLEVNKKQESTCQAVNSVNNHSFDLSPLQGDVWLLAAPSHQASKRIHFYISVCKELPQLRFGYCGYNAGVCMEIDGVVHMLAVSSKDLQYQGHRLVLNYGPGSLCVDKELYTTEISFICKNEFFPRNGPQYVGTLGCTHTFTFYTSLACDRNSQSCSPIHGEGIDLVSLMQPTAPYRVETSEGHIFLLNVCGALPMPKKTGCKDGSAACMIHSGIRTGLPMPVSLGFPFSRPVLDHLPGNRRPQVVWKYSGGDPCPNTHTNSSKVTASASIRFICNPSIGPGRPKYEGFVDKDCVYRFSWKTSVVCLEDRVDFDRQSCLLTNRGTQETFNLSELYPPQDLKNMAKGLKPSLTGENLYVYLCSWPQHWMNEANTIECKDTAVCANTGDGNGNFTGYGFQHFAYYDSNNNTIKIFFRGTYRHSCSDREISGAEIWFPCATDKKMHKPKLLAATECHVVIEWPSPLMCGIEEHENARLSSIRTAWKTMVTLLAIAIVLSGSLYVVRKTNCWPVTRSRVNRAMGYKRSPLVTYRAEPQEEWTEFETLNE